MRPSRETGNWMNILYKQSGRSHDIHLIGALVNIASAVKRSAAVLPEDENELLELAVGLENMIAECFKVPALDSPEMVTRVLLRLGQHASTYGGTHRAAAAAAASTSYHPRRSLALSPSSSSSSEREIVSFEVKAHTFLQGPVRECLESDLNKTLGLAPLMRHTGSVFVSSLKGVRMQSMKEVADLFELRSVVSSCRYCPMVMFAFEGLSKLLCLASVIVVATQDGSSLTVISLFGATFSFSELYLVVMWITSVGYEAGEILSRWNFRVKGYINNVFEFRDVLYIHLSTRWNIIDFATITCLWFWLWHKMATGVTVNVYLSMAAIPATFCLLRFQSMNEEAGLLIIMIFEVTNSLVYFVFILMVCMAGFGITFYCAHLNSAKESKMFGTVQSTALTLFDAAVGQHDFTGLENEYVGIHAQTNIIISLMVIYVIFVSIVLMNLFIARLVRK